MDERPFGVWREVDPSDPNRDERHWLVRQYGTVYAAMTHLGYKANEVGALPVWKIASILGVDAPDTDDDATGDAPGSAAEGHKMLRARLAHENDPEHNPKPEAPAPRRAEGEAVRRRLEREATSAG